MTTLLTLPSEITIKIFTTVIVDSGDVPPQPVVLLLASICKTLRELVLNSPTLWSRIRLRTFNDLESAPLFFRRSKECLLEVSLSFHRDLVPDITETRFFNVIAANMARWRKLTIRGPMSSEVKTFLQEIIGTPTPSLMEVFLLPSEHAACDEDHRPLLSGASDALRALTMRGCISCLAPFPNLTKLNIFRLNCNYEEFRRLIQGSPNLATLILGELQDTFPMVTVMEPIVSHRPLIEALSLRYFAVGFANSEPLETYAKPLLVSLSMPNLHYLEVVGSRADYGELSGKPFPALKKLCLRDMDFPASSAALYRSFTTITSLELYFVQGARLLMAPDEDGKTPWPHLQTLRCENWGRKGLPMARTTRRPPTTYGRTPY
ncbi:hypothetical protein B0H14DRAFT_1558672 [Mycena olivaceomarginata]|nr:hypothetical protein B0H14DRAFT_1558672 [Mycena olivaceomarginata]